MALEKYLILFFKDKLDNKADDERGNVAKGAEVHHIYIAGEKEFE